MRLSLRGVLPMLDRLDYIKIKSYKFKFTFKYYL